jgi:predicted nucleic acid-binding protein
LVSSIPATEFQLCLSVGLYTEWQEVLTRPENLPAGRTPDDALAFLRYLAGESYLQEIHFLWRPFLRDADDDMVLELAFAADCRHIITHNVKDFHGSGQLGVTACTPREFLNLIRKQP